MLGEAEAHSANCSAQVVSAVASLTYRVAYAVPFSGPNNPSAVGFVEG